MSQLCQDTYSLLGATVHYFFRSLLKDYTLVAYIGGSVRHHDNLSKMFWDRWTF